VRCSRRRYRRSFIWPSPNGIGQVDKAGGADVVGASYKKAKVAVTAGGN